MLFFFFQAEDGIRDLIVTGVQTCALPICPFTAESRWFFAPRADASDTTFQIYAKNDPLADYRIYRINIGGDLGYGFRRFSELRFGYEVGSLNTKLRLGTPQIPAVEGRVGSARLHY